MLDLDDNILAIDIGKGTEDIFYYEPNKKLENCIQIIKPSYAQILRKTLESYLNTNHNIYLDGSIMGGEPWHLPLYKIAQNPNRNVIMSSNSAYSLRYNLDQVKAKGIKIQDPMVYHSNPRNIKLETKDINFKWYQNVFQGLNIDLFSECETVLLACQEHGYSGPQGGSAREFRMREYYQRYLENSSSLTSLMFHSSEIPDFAWRFKSNVKLTKSFFPHSEVFIMDSSPAVVLGTILDSFVPEGPKTVINMGNGHTLVMILDGTWDVMAIWEHHTGSFISDPRKLDDYLNRIFRNELSQEEVLQEGGHGFYKKVSEIPQNAANTIVVLGPNRNLLKESFYRDSIIWAHPLGSMMLSGPAGLLKTYEIKSKEEIR